MALYFPRSSGPVPLPYSLGLPFPLSQVSLAYPVCSLFPAVSSLVLERDFGWLWGFTAPGLLQLLQSLLWTPSTHQLQTALYNPSPPVPAAVILLVLCTFQGVPVDYFGVLLFSDFSDTLGSLSFSPQKCWYHASLWAISSFHLHKFWGLWCYLVSQVCYRCP